MKSDYKFHQPVLLKETLEGLFPNNAPLHQAQMIDATVGFGGHAIEFAKKGIDVLGIDQNQETLKITQKLISACSSSKQKFGRIVLVNGNFKNIDKIAKSNGFFPVDAILFDFGVSSYQITDSQLGFSYSNPNALLDMRMDPDSNGITGADLLNCLNKNQLSQLFGEIVDYRKSSAIVKNIINYKAKGNKFYTIGDYLKVIPESGVNFLKSNPATKYFLALRIAVNSELENISIALPLAWDLLKVNGRMAVISFHSKEDAVVKNIIKTFDNCLVINKKPIIATKEELEMNKRCRSAKLRIIEKI